MPWYRHSRNETLAESRVAETHSVYYSPSDANTGIDRTAETVTFEASEYEEWKWMARERERFESGEYAPVPWENNFGQETEIHFAHLSKKSPGFIAYTENHEKGVQDRQTTVRPGKYLLQFYPELSQADIDEYCRLCKPRESFGTFSLATTADEIERVYLQRDSESGAVIDSCMNRFHTWRHETPVRAYGGTDMAIAYLGPIDAIIARCIVAPGRKAFGRLYGASALGRSEHEHATELRNALEKDGYQNAYSGQGTAPAHFHGLKVLRAVEVRGGYLCPYVDGSEANADLDGEFFVLRSNGEYDLQTVRGTVEEKEPEPDRTCDRCGDSFFASESDSSDYCQSCEDDRRSCEHCETHFWPDESDDTTYCPSCYDAAVTCEHCSDTSFDTDDMTSLADGSYICADCAKELTCECAQCQDEWIETAVFSYREREDRKRHRLNHLCADCASEHRVCLACPDPTDETERISLPLDVPQCPTCHHTFRCNRTLDLLSIPVIPNHPVHLWILIMKFHKRHYVAIAEILAAVRANDADLFLSVNLDAIADKLADSFERDNPKFNRARFLRACGV